MRKPPTAPPVKRQEPVKCPTERLIHDLNQRILRVGDPDLKDKCHSLALQLAFAIGLDEHAIEAKRKAVGA